jgi:hypothetical protein
MLCGGMLNQIQFGTRKLKNNFLENPEPRVLKYEKSCPELKPEVLSNFLKILELESRVL